MRKPLSIQDASIQEMGKQHIMAAGPPGTGKTLQFLTLPGKKIIFVFDPNCIPLLVRYGKNQDLDVMPFIVELDEVDLAVKSLSKDGGAVRGDRSKRGDLEPTTYVEFEDTFQPMVESGELGKYDWVGFDGLTYLGEIVMDRVTYINKRFGKQPERDDWTAQMNTFKNIYRAVTNCGCHTYTTCHVETVKDEVTGRTGGQLVITGKLRVKFPTMFTNIFGMGVEMVGDKGKFTVQTVPDRYYPACRSNIPGIKAVEDVTVDFKKDLIGQGIGGILLKAGLI